MGNASAQATCDVFAGIDLTFAPGATALTSAERERIAMEVERIRRADYCPFAGLNIRGHTDRTEGLSPRGQAVSLARANYVARLFELSGIPKDLVSVESAGDRQPVAPPPSSKNSRVEVQVYAGCPSAACSFPMKADGLRLPK